MLQEFKSLENQRKPLGNCFLSLALLLPPCYSFLCPPGKKLIGFFRALYFSTELKLIYIEGSVLCNVLHRGSNNRFGAIIEALPA